MMMMLRRRTSTSLVTLPRRGGVLRRQGQQQQQQRCRQTLFALLPASTTTTTKTTTAYYEPQKRRQHQQQHQQQQQRIIQQLSSGRKITAMRIPPPYHHSVRHDCCQPPLLLSRSSFFFSTSTTAGGGEDPSLSSSSSSPAASYDDGDESLPSPTTNSSNQRRMEFRVRAALEMKEEKQKLRLAQIVNELLVEEEHDFSTTATTTTTATCSQLPPQQLYQRDDEESSNAKTKNNKTGAGAAAANIAVEEISLTGVPFQRLDQVADRILCGRCCRLDKPSLLDLIRAARERLQTEPTLIDLRDNSFFSAYHRSSQISVVGDVHGSLPCLKQVLNLLGPPNNPTDRIVIFAGDYVDRGTRGIEVLTVALILKLRYPSNVILLRGNHEDRDVATAYGFRDEIHDKYSAALGDVWGSVKRLFAAMPLAVVTTKAFVCHGGIPSEHFSLNDLAVIAPESRCRMISTVSPESEEEELVRGLLWSDPCTENGIYPNPRGCGIRFGPDVAYDFLKREGLQYVVRAHEPVEEGWSKMYCNRDDYDDIAKVFTVFSAASYPNGQGSNFGAVLHFLNGTYKVDTFDYQPLEGDADDDGDDGGESGRHHLAKHSSMDGVYDEIRSLVAGNRFRLKEAFHAINNYDDENCFITVEEWAKVLGQVLELSEIERDLITLQPVLAPNINDNNYNSDGAPLVDWKVFLNRNKGSFFMSKSLDKHNAEILQQNYSLLLTIFNYLDVTGNGTIDMEEFQQGVEVLNRRLPEDRQIMKPLKLFHELDLDGNGKIDVDEFKNFFSLL